MTMQNILKAMLFTPVHGGGGKFTGRWGIPLMFVGGPGEAKTSIISSVTESYGMELEVLSPGERGEGAFGVVPVPQDGVLTYPAPEWVYKFAALHEDGSLDPNGKAGLVFVDEANTGGPSIQSPLLGLINDGRIGGSMLPPRVRRIGAMNEEADAAGGWALAPALCNRFGWVPWAAPTELPFTSYWLGGATDVMSVVDAAAEEQRVLDAWMPAWATAVGTVTSFLNRTPGMLTTKPFETERSFASRRTIAFAMHALAASTVHGLDTKEREALVKGFVGTTWWNAYTAFLSKMNLPDPLDILDGKVAWKFDPARIDVAWAVLSSCTSHVVNENDKALRNKRGELLWSLLATTLDDAPDVALTNAVALSSRAVALANKHATKVCAKLEDFRRKLAAVK